jgi:predicted PurR-regulated permease PerM
MQDSKMVKISNSSIIRFILIALLAYVLFLLRNILLLVLAAIVIASFVEAGVRAFARRGVKRSLSVPIIFVLGLIIIFAVLYSFVPIIFTELSNVISIITTYLPNTTAITPESIQHTTQLVTTLSEKFSLSDFLGNIKTAATSLSSGVTSIIGTTFGGLVDLLLVLFMSFYLSIEERGMTTFLRILTPAKHENYVIDLWRRTQYKIGVWFQGQMLLGLIMGVLTFIVLTILGVNYSFLIAVITGISELIPFGIIFAAIPAIIFAAINGGVLLAFKVLIFYVLAQQVENYALAPIIARKIVGIPPLVVLLSFLIGISLAGFWGALVAMPVAVFILEYMGDVEKQKLVTVSENPNAEVTE